MIELKGDLYEFKFGFLRSLVDLQFRSINQQLRKAVRQPAGKNFAVLDYGSGKAPYWHHFKNCQYLRLDPLAPADIKSLKELKPRQKFDRILLIEVLEHIENPMAVLRALKQRLRPKGELWISVPFSARIHRVPEDYWRFTDQGLTKLLRDSGFKKLVMEYRGNSLSTVCSKINYLCFKKLGVFSAPVVFFPLLFGQLSLLLPPRKTSDPLGFFVRAS